MKANSLALAAVLAVVVTATAAGRSLGAERKASPTTVTVRASEFALIPSATSVPAGKVTFVVRNMGKISHDFVVLRTSLAPGKLPTTGAVAKEVGLQGKTPVFGPGQTRRLTLTLRPGSYVLICNVAGHYKAGMYAGLRASY